MTVDTASENDNWLATTRIPLLLLHVRPAVTLDLSSAVNKFMVASHAIIKGMVIDVGISSLILLAST